MICGIESGVSKILKEIILLYICKLAHILLNRVVGYIQFKDRGGEVRIFTYLIDGSSIAEGNVGCVITGAITFILWLVVVEEHANWEPLLVDLIWVEEHCKTILDAVDVVFSHVGCGRIRLECRWVTRFTSGPEYILHEGNWFYHLTICPCKCLGMLKIIC